MIDALAFFDRGKLLPLRRRPDVKIVPSPHADARHELAKDPVALRYFELPEEEAFLLKQFDGATGREEIRLRFEQRFAPRRLSAEQLDQFVARLFRQGLLLTDRSGQGPVLLQRTREQKAERLRRCLMSPLAITLPGIDPRPVLDRLMPLVGWVFTRTFVVAAIVSAVAALATALLHGTKLAEEVAAFTGSLTLDGLAAAACVVAAMKVVHELAHAAACRRFGGECREIGVLLLVGIPALYCDVTGVWMVRERWKRVVVGAAGMLAEMVLASSALLLWNASEPSLFHTLCLQVAVVCSVATVVFNGNPLLRYDGYFILSDLTGITNLGEQADAALRSRLAGWFFGGSTNDDERASPASRRAWLAWYAAASLAYKLFVTIGILWFVRTLLEPKGLTIVADMMAVAVLGTTVVLPAIRGGRQVGERVRAQQVDGRRFALRAGGCLFVLAAILFWPWNYRVAAPAIVLWDEAPAVLVTTPGKLIEAAAEGMFVKKGATIAKLENLEIERELVHLRGEQLEKSRAIESLERRRADDPAAGEELPTARKALEAVEHRLRLRETEAQRLTLTAPVAGVVLSLPASQAARIRGDADAPAEPVPELFDSPLETRRLGRFIEAGTPLCVVGSPERVEAVLVVDEREIEFVRKQDRVRLQFDATGTMILEGTVFEIAERTLDDAPQELLIAGRLPSQVDASGNRRTAATYFQVRVRLAPGSPRLPLDAIGQAKIDTAPQSLARRAVRWLSGTFRLPMQQPEL